MSTEKMRNNSVKEQKIVGIVGNVVRQARIAAGLSPIELADNAALFQNDISAIENGRRNVTIISLDRLADAMNTDLKISFEPRQA